MRLIVHPSWCLGPASLRSAGPSLALRSPSDWRRETTASALRPARGVPQTGFASGSFPALIRAATSAHTTSPRLIIPLGLAADVKKIGARPPEGTLVAALATTRITNAQRPGYRTAVPSDSPPRASRYAAGARHAAFAAARPDRSRQAPTISASRDLALFRLSILHRIQIMAAPALPGRALSRQARPSRGLSALRVTIAATLEAKV